MSKRSKRTTTAVLALALVGATVAIIAASASSKGQTARTRTPVHHAVSARLDHILGVLEHRGARAYGASLATGAQPLPTAIFQGVSHEAALDPAAAVYAGGAYPTWVIPGSTEVCLMANGTKAGDSAGGICGSTAALEQRGLAEVTEGPTGAPLVLGLVPNGNATIEVTNSNGTTETVPVHNNVYEVTAGDPVSATMKDAAGAAVTRILPTLATPPSSAPPRG